MTKKEIGDLKMQLAVVEKERNELKENLTLLEVWLTTIMIKIVDYNI